ncbi:MAG: aminotransferase class I/II-fold pyridoxal phosphate-dependent enzyme, partial [Hymenobacter sp.]
VLDKMKALVGHMGAWAPKAEQVAAAAFLPQTEAVDDYLTDIKATLQASLDAAYQGLKALRAQGYPVDAIAPAGAIYLTAKIDVLGRTTPTGEVLASTQEITAYLLTEAKLAVVPFSAFGTTASAPWFRLSVGAESSESIQAALPRLQGALDKLN